MLSGLFVAALVVSAVVFRSVHFRRMSRFALRRRVLGPDGIVVGGAGFELSRPGAPAVLLLHGGGDTPQTLRYLGDELYRRGFHVVAPLLPGHGRRLEDFARLSAADLSRSVDESYKALRATHEWVGVAGLSMGGALAVQLAAKYSDIPALGLVAPYLAMPANIERWARAWWLWGLVLPAANATDGRSILDPSETERNLAYGVFTPRALRALQQTVNKANAVAALVRAPTLVIQSTQDNRIAASAAQRAFDRLGSLNKQIEWVSGAAHIITVDFGRDQVIDRLASFMEACCPVRSDIPTQLDNSNKRSESTR